ncbi:hypothetical protein BY458DRAFT_518011 [Sporodiniella umbellata]|nr:hypothetical protein BY458DRAFT_518011 [Sporodiniella umbellata]
MNFAKQLTTTTLRTSTVRTSDMTSRKIVSNIVNERFMSAYSNMSDNNPEILEKEKQKHLNSENKEWSEKLASTSEASVKADKEDDVSIKELEEASAKAHAKDRQQE